MSTPGKNARKRAKRAAVVPTFNMEPEDLEPYPQPQRCKSCGNWVLMMCMVGTGACCMVCEDALKEKDGRGTTVS